MAKVGKSPRGRYPLPQNLTPDGRVCFCLNLPDDPQHFAVFWGMMDTFTHRYNWGEPLTADSDTVAAYWAQIVQDNRECFEEVLEMANRGCGCGGESIYRYTEAGVQEVSDDGGATWSEAGSDPRVSGTLFPPPPWLILGDNNRCGGAISATEAIQFITTQITSGPAWDTIFTIIEAILAVIAILLPGVGAVISALITAIAYVLFLAGQAALEAAMTEGVYATLKCIFYCRIEDDATFTPAGWTKVKNDIAAQLDGIAEAWAWHFVNILGPTGLSNAARLAATVAGNCDECDCATCDIDNVWQYSYPNSEWFQPAPSGENTVDLVSNSNGVREIITVAFGAPYPDGKCCNIVSWEQIAGNQIFIVDQVDCADVQTSGALPPAGCWKQVTIYSQLEPEPPQVWRMTLGEECP